MGDNTRNIKHDITCITVTGDAGEIQRGSDGVAHIPSPLPIMVSVHADINGWRIDVVGMGVELPPIEKYSVVAEALARLARPWE